MIELISTISDICGIIGLGLAFYAVNQVRKIKQTIKGDNNTQSTLEGKVGGDFIGRDRN